MIPIEVHKRINKLETELTEKWKNKISEKVDKALEKGGDYGILVLKYVPNGTVSTIFIDTNKLLLRKINVYNHHVWNYLINNLHLSKVKSVSVLSDNEHDVYYENDTLKFDDDFYNELDEIFNDEEYKELRKIVYGKES